MRERLDTVLPFPGTTVLLCTPLKQHRLPVITPDIICAVDSECVGTKASCEKSNVYIYIYIYTYNCLTFYYYKNAKIFGDTLFQRQVIHSENITIPKVRP